MSDKKYCGLKVGDEHKSALYMDFGYVKCQNCGQKVSREQAQKFLDYNLIEENKN